MSATLPHEPAGRHHLLPDVRVRMAKAGAAEVRKAEIEAWRGAVGRAIERTRTLSQRSLKEFADAIGRDERQVARWIIGAERPQFDAIVAVEALRRPLLIALAELVESDGVEIVTEIRVRRIA